MKFPYQLIELTHTLDETSPSWEENCGFSSSIVLDYADCTETTFRVQHLTMPAGMGTHMDAPAHCCPNGISHCILLNSGRYIVENIANSEQLPSTGSFIMAFPLKIRQATAAPMRLIGLLP